MKTRFNLLFILSICAVNILLGIAPPKKGVTVSPYLIEEFKQIRSEYSSGYWPQEMTRRRHLLESGNVELVAQAATPTTVIMPVLLGHYSDSQPKYSRQNLQNDLFDSNPKGTVTQFYNEISYGHMYLTGTVSDWAGVPQTLLYYAGTTGLSQPRDFVIDLLFSIDPTFDFSPYVDPTSLDAEGYHVRLIATIHTGGGAESGAKNIWSHRWNIRERIIDRKADPTDTLYNNSKILSTGHFLTNDTYLGQPVVVDGDYACEPEISGVVSGGLIEIGVFCHEFGHLFGLPDLYNTNSSTDQGLGNWCLMAGGSWGGDGTTPSKPAHMCAWCKTQLGWVTPTVVTSFLPQQSIKKVEKFPDVYKLWSLGQSSTEYFLVENRERVGFDTSLTGGGLLIFHVDENQSSIGNTDPNHHWVDLEQADGLRGLNIGTNRGDAGDPFPGSTNNKTFDGYTNPNSVSYYSNAQSYVGVRNISNEADTMYADLDVGTHPYLRLVSMTQSDANTISPNRIEPGETGVLNLTIENINPAPTTSSRIYIKGGGTGFSIDTTSTPLALAGLSQTVIPTLASVRLQSSFVPKEVPITVVMQAENFLDSTTVTIVFGYPSLVLMDGDSIAQTNVMYVRAALDSLSHYYEVIRARDSISSDADLQRRSTIVYLSGSKKFETINGNVLNTIVQFYLHGGRVVISGQNIAEDLQARSVAELSNVFHVKWSKNLVIGKSVYGVPSDPLGANIAMLSLAGGDGASNQTSLDILLADEVSIPCLTYSSVGGTNVAGVHVEQFSTNSKLVFLGFGIEAINNLSSTTSRAAVMQSILNWFETPVGVKTDVAFVPYEWKLKPAYPNPFNPSAKIIFEAAKKSNVDIALFNVLGQKVRTIFSAEVNAGQHEATIDGSGLPSGIYFCRMKAEGFSTVQRLALLK